MSITPFIRPIKVQGGTFYTCTSAQADLNFSLDQTKKKFRFSNFALLKIPELKQLTTDNNEDLINSNVSIPNKIQIDSTIGASRWYREDAGVTTPKIRNNVAFAESFQNYYYNLETILLKRNNFDVEQDRTVSERVFFKWLKEIGAMRFRQANDSEVVSPSENLGTRFVEENNTFDATGSPIYERVVKYIGNINVVNSIRNPQNSYTEVYIHLPTTHGHTRDVLFDSIVDSNYSPGMILPTKNTGGNVRALEGREIVDKNPSSLTNRGFFDSLRGFDRCWYFNEDTNQFEPYKKDEEINSDFKWWFDHFGSSNNSYYIEPSGFSNVINEVYAIGHTDEANPNDLGSVNSTKFIRNALDGISIEFNPDTYKKIKATPDIKSFGEYNESSYANNFSFNTVLVYYDIYDVDDPESVTTNLFGILFLDNVDEIAGTGLIPSIHKYKPNSVLQQNGNSYAFRLNVKFDVHAQEPAVEININDYNTFSLQLYLDALSGMKTMAEKTDAHIEIFKKLKEKVNYLKSMVFTQENYNELERRVEDVEKRIRDSEKVFLNNQNIINLINNNYKEITNIYKNESSVEMSYNIDVIKNGMGIDIDRSKKNAITINNSRQAFNISDKPIIRIDEDFSAQPEYYQYFHILKEFDNYIRIGDNIHQSPYIVDRDVNIYIDDSDISWKKGQKIRISFSYGLNMNNVNGSSNILIYTDAQDTLFTGFEYNLQASIITFDNFNEKNRFKPIIEIICIDPEKYHFITDIF